VRRRPGCDGGAPASPPRVDGRSPDLLGHRRHGRRLSVQQNPVPCLGGFKLALKLREAGGIMAMRFGSATDQCDFSGGEVPKSPRTTGNCDQLRNADTAMTHRMTPAAATPEACRVVPAPG